MLFNGLLLPLSVVWDGTSGCARYVQKMNLSAMRWKSVLSFRSGAVISSSCDLVGPHHQASRPRPGFPTAISNPERRAKCSREKRRAPSN